MTKEMKKRMSGKTANTDVLKMLNKELRLIKKNVTAGDKTEFMKKTKCAKSTISHYLNGKAVNEKKATHMYVFFCKRIEKRKSDLNKLLNDIGNATNTEA